MFKSHVVKSFLHDKLSIIDIAVLVVYFSFVAWILNTESRFYFTEENFLITDGQVILTSRAFCWKGT